MAALLVTAGAIWLEGFYALDPQRPPDEPGAPHPGATAVIAAYLPNEAATIFDTVEAFQRVDYPGPLQILVAYNTPHPMAVEDELREMARRDPRILPLKVENSTSKAQNVNAAMSHVTGEFVGMFDADHHPEPGAFRRAWRWLSNGYDVVQGHCVIRNGDASLVARTVAVEFESIYAVSHPGRTAMHGFGLFGGSNGYWRTSLLAETRMHGSMLTEDIDSTLRVLAAGAKIASDPALISYELAPTNVTSLWKQRARWAQGWFQVSRKHLRLTIASPHLSAPPEERAGVPAGLARDLPLALAADVPGARLHRLPRRRHHPAQLAGARRCSWPRLFTLAVGPAQTLFAWRLAVPEIRERSSWFWSHLLVSSLVYTEWKNIIGRIAQIKELVGESQWNVTPRTGADDHRAPSPPPAPPPGGERMTTRPPHRPADVTPSDADRATRTPEGAPPRPAPASSRATAGWSGLTHRRLPRGAVRRAGRRPHQPGARRARPLRDRRRAVPDVGVPADPVLRPRGAGRHSGASRPGSSCSGGRCGSCRSTGSASPSSGRSATRRCRATGSTCSSTSRSPRSSTGSGSSTRSARPGR